MDDATESSAEDATTGFSAVQSETSEEQATAIVDVAEIGDIGEMSEAEQPLCQQIQTTAFEAGLIESVGMSTSTSQIESVHLPMFTGNVTQSKSAEFESNLRHTSSNTDVDDFVRQLQMTNIELSSRIDIVTAEKRDLLEQLQRRMVEYDQLKTDHAEMVRERAEAQRVRIETQVQLDETRADDATRRFREERLRSELSELQKQVTWLDEQLNSKQNELFQVRKDNVERLQDTSLEATRLRSRCAELERELAEMRAAAEQKDVVARRHTDALRELRESFDALDGKYARELEAQTRLAALYRDANDDAERRCAELTRAVSELQQLVRDASSEVLRVEAAKRAEVERADVTVAEKQTQLDALHNENARLTEQLDEAKRELEMIRLRRKRVPLLGIDPDAPAQDTATSGGDPQELSFAARFLAQRGLTFTQMFNEYVDVCEAFEDERAESTRLRNSLSQLEGDVRAKEPIYRRQRDELLKALDSLSALTQRVETQAADSLELQRRNEELLRKQASWRDDVERYRQRCTDLAEQVRTLLVQLEGRNDLHDTSLDADSDDAQSVIRSRLVTFRSVAELQTRNEELLVLVRTLSEKRERQERDELDMTTRDFREQIEALETQLAELRSVREEQTNAIDALIEQREMYKALFVQFARSGANLPFGNPDSQPPFAALLTAVQQLVEQHVASSTSKSPADAPPAPPPPPAAPAELKQAEANAVELEACRRLVTDLETRLAAANEKLQRVSDELDSTKRSQLDRETAQRTEHDEVRKQLQDARHQNARVQSQCELAVERCKLLQSTLDGYKKEIESLRDSNQLYTKLVGDHERSIGTMKQELVNINERAVRAEVQLAMTREQLTIVKHAEQRLISDLEAARQSHQSHQLVLNNLQALQNRLDIDEWETKARLGSQIKLYEAECTELRKRVQEERETHDTILRSLERERNEARTLHETERVEHDSTRRKLADAEALVRQIRGRITSLEADRCDMNVSTRDESESVGADGHSNDVVVELERVSSEAQRLRVALTSNESQLEGARRNITEFKKLVGMLEKSLADQMSTHRTVCNELNQRLDTQTQRAADAEREQERLAQELAALRQKADVDQRDLAAKVEALRSEAAITAKRNADLETRLKQVDVYSSESHVDLEMRAQLANEYRMKFEAESSEHSRDVQLLVDAKRRLEEAETALVRRSHEYDTRCTMLQNERDALKNNEERLRADFGRLETLLADAQAENRVLFERFDALNAKLAYHESRQRDPLAGLPTTNAFLTPSTPAATTLLSAGEQQLTELVKLVRREKEIATTQCELVRAEADRFRMRAELAERQAESLRTNVNDLQARLAESIEKSAQHAELTSRLEQLSVFQESNRVLRDEKERLLTRVRQLEAASTNAERELNDARTKLGEVQRSCDTAQVERDVLHKEVTSLRQRIAALNEQAAQHALLANQNSQLRTDSETLQNQMTALRSQLETATKSEAAAKKQAEEKENVITQLKTIGRKYKTESQTARTQLEELQTRVRSLESAQAETDASRSARSVQLEAEVTRLQEELRRSATHQAELNSVRNELTVLKKHKADVDEAHARGVSQIRQANEKIASLQAELTQLKNLHAQSAAASAQRPNVPDPSTEERVRRLELELGRMKQQKELKARLVDEYDQKIKELQAENEELRRRVATAIASAVPQAAATGAIAPAIAETIADEQPATSQSAAGISVQPQSDATADAQAQVHPSQQQQPPAAAVKPVVSAVRPTVQAAPVAASPIPVAPLPQIGASRQTASIRPMPVSSGPVTQTSASVITAQSAAGATMTVTATVTPLQPAGTSSVATTSAVLQQSMPLPDLSVGVSSANVETTGAQSDVNESAATTRMRRGLIRAAAAANAQQQQQQVAQRGRPGLPLGNLFAAVGTPQSESSAEQPNTQPSAVIASRRSPTSAQPQQQQGAAVDATNSRNASILQRVKRNAAAAQLVDTQQSVAASNAASATASVPVPTTQLTSPTGTADLEDESAHALAPKRTRREEESESAALPSGIQVHVVAPQPHTLANELQAASEVSSMQTDDQLASAHTNETAAAPIVAESNAMVVETEPESGAIVSSGASVESAVPTGLQSEIPFQHELAGEVTSSITVPVDSGEQHAEMAVEQSTDVLPTATGVDQEVRQPVDSDVVLHGARPEVITSELRLNQVERSAPLAANEPPSRAAEHDDASTESSSVIMLSSGSEDEDDEDDDGASDNAQRSYEEELAEYEAEGDDGENEEDYEEEQLEEGEAVEQHSDGRTGESVGDEAVSEGEHDDEADGDVEEAAEHVEVHDLSGDTVVETDSVHYESSEHDSQREGSTEQQHEDSDGNEQHDDAEEAERGSEATVEDAENSGDAEPDQPVTADVDDDEPTTVPKNPQDAQVSTTPAGFAIEMESEMSEFAEEERAAEQLTSVAQQATASTTGIVPASSAPLTDSSQPVLTITRTQQRISAAQLSDLEKRSLRFGAAIGQPPVLPTVGTAPTQPTVGTTPIQPTVGTTPQPNPNAAPGQPSLQPANAGVPQQPATARVRMAGGQMQRAAQPTPAGNSPAMAFRGPGVGNQFRWRPQSAAGAGAGSPAGTGPGVTTRQPVASNAPEAGTGPYRARFATQPVAVSAPTTGTSGIPTPGSNIIMPPRGALLGQQGTNTPRFGGPPLITPSVSGMQRPQMSGSGGQPGIGMPIQQLANNPFALRRASPQLGALRSGTPIPRGAPPPGRGGPGSGSGSGPNV